MSRVQAVLSGCGWEEKWRSHPEGGVWLLGMVGGENSVTRLNREAESVMFDVSGYAPQVGCEL